jgi:hypothetical protein
MMCAKSLKWIARAVLMGSLDQKVAEAVLRHLDYELDAEASNLDQRQELETPSSNVVRLSTDQPDNPGEKSPGMVIGMPRGR